MSQTTALGLTQEFLSRYGGHAEPAKVAELFSEDAKWECPGDIGALPWIGIRSGRSAVIDFVKESWDLLDHLAFEVHHILADETRAVVLGFLSSKVKRTGKVMEFDFAVVLTTTNGQIVRLQMFEDSFDVSKAARGD